MQGMSHSVRLAVDLGNSVIKVGLFSEEQILDVFASPSLKEVVAHISSWNRQTSLRRIGICSVVPDRTKLLIVAIHEFSDVSIFEVSHHAKSPIQIAYTPATSLGHDRLVAACAAWKPGRSHIVVDAGTAVTVDLINAEGVFLGGAIMPGPEIGNRALSEYTANLPNVPLLSLDGAFGTSTVEALQYGLVHGMIDGIIGTITRMRESISHLPAVTLTGGWAHLLAKYIPEAHVRENLVLHGVRALMEFNGQ